MPPGASERRCRMPRPKRALRVLKVAVLSEFFIMLVGSQFSLTVQAQALSESTQRVIFANDAFLGPSTATPQWDNVRLYDYSGSKVSEAAIWFSESLRVLIYSATATPDGRIIAGGKAERSDGTSAPFIALTDRAGKVTSVIWTAGFAPVNVCQAPDGTVWSFGSTGYDEHSQPKPGDTLRHFDFQKGQIGSYLPRSTFPRSPAPETLGYIRCLSDGLVAYGSKSQEYLEMKYSGDTPHLYHAKVPAGLRQSGIAVTTSKRVYGYFFQGGQGGLYCLSVDGTSNTARWVPVGGTVGAYTEPGVVIGLWGSDGDSLVVSRTGDTAGEAALHWATTPTN